MATRERAGDAVGAAVEVAVAGLVGVGDGGVVDVAVGTAVWVAVGAAVAVAVAVGVAVDAGVGTAVGLGGRQPAASSPAAQALNCWRNLRREIILFILHRLYQVSTRHAIG